MPNTDEPGPVEGRYRAWVTTLGSLSPRQEAEAAHLFRLCQELDLQTERPASALAALSRAVAKAADRIRDQKNAAAPTAPVVDSSTPENIVDELKRRRQERQGTA